MLSVPDTQSRYVTAVASSRIRDLFVGSPTSISPLYLHLATAECLYMLFLQVSRLDWPLVLLDLAVWLPNACVSIHFYLHKIKRNMLIEARDKS